MTRIRSIVSLAALAALTLPSLAEAQPKPPTKPMFPLEYAVKFVCGGNIRSKVPLPLLATGRYYTAINIHNPNFGAELTWKVSLAALDKPGEISPFNPFIGLKYDESMDLDCNSIRQWLSANSIPAPPLITGFVVIQTHRELDVVSVYTAGPESTNEVQTLHTERVPVRRVQ
jgi:hypothetical protein